MQTFPFPACLSLTFLPWQLSAAWKSASALMQVPRPFGLPGEGCGYQAQCEAIWWEELHEEAWLAAPQKCIPELGLYLL